jgi:hypothetical protein
LQSLMKEIAMMLLLLGYVGGVVLGFKILCVVLSLMVCSAGSSQQEGRPGALLLAACMIVRKVWVVKLLLAGPIC